jgi:hypothetical protein
VRLARGLWKGFPRRLPRPTAAAQDLRVLNGCYRDVRRVTFGPSFPLIDRVRSRRFSRFASAASLPSAAWRQTTSRQIAHRQQRPVLTYCSIEVRDMTCEICGPGDKREVRQPIEVESHQIVLCHKLACGHQWHTEMPSTSDPSHNRECDCSSYERPHSSI